MMPTFADRLAAVLQLFAPGPAPAFLSARARSIGGYGEQNLRLVAPFTAGAPMALLTLLADEWCVRLSPFTWSDDQYTIKALPMLVAVWRPKATHDGHGHHVVTEAGSAAVVAGLQLLPAPTVLIDAGPEVVGCWQLAQPLTDLAVARHALELVADRTGATAPPANLTELDFPIGGVVRNWNSDAPNYIQIVDVDPSRRYSLDELLSAGEPHVHVDENRAGTSQSDRGRRGRDRAPQHV